MPSDASGNYTLPVGYLGTTGGVIQISQHNPPLEDLAAGLTARLMRSGAAPMTGPLKLTDGLASAPAIAFASAPTTGLFKTTNGYAVTINGTQVVEFGPAGILSGVVTASFADKAVTLAKLYHPSGPSLLLGTDSNAALTITGTANNGSGLIRLIMADTSTFTTGQSKTVSDVTGTTEANGTWTITVIDGTHIDLQGSTFANAWISGGTIGGGVEEITIGAGLKLTGASLTAGFAPPAAFKNLLIKVASNTTVTVAADFVATTNGTQFQTTALSGTINMATTGVNALDTGTIAAATWYAIWGIAKPDGTTAALASLSATAPTMPTGYTFKARIGWVRTAAGSAQLLGTWQLGRRAQYVNGLAQTTALPQIGQGPVGSVTVPTYVSTSVSSFVPSTASEIILAAGVGNLATGVTLVAPNASYAAHSSLTNSPPINVQSTSGNNQNITVSSLLLESANIYLALSVSSSIVNVFGWVDNL